MNAGNAADGPSRGCGAAGALNGRGAEGAVVIVTSGSDPHQAVNPIKSGDGQPAQLRIDDRQQFRRLLDV